MQPDRQHTHRPHTEIALRAACTALNTRLPVRCVKARGASLYRCPSASFTYLGKVVLVLTLLEGVAVEIRRLVGQLRDDGVLHLVCGTDGWR